MEIGTIIGEIRVELVDPDGDTWTDSDLFGHLTEAQNSVISLRPSANYTTVDFTPATQAEQVSPGLALVDVYNNVGGNPISKQNKKDMDSLIPGWRSESTATEIEHFIYEEENPKIFWLYPYPSVDTLEVRLAHSLAIESIVSTSQTITLADNFLVPIKEYVYWKCYSKQKETGSQNEAMTHLQNFYMHLGEKFKGEQIFKAKKK